MHKQSELSASQIKSFYHDEFVADQVADFKALLGSGPRPELVADKGGGCGYFARALSSHMGLRTRVIDSDPESVRICIAAGQIAEIGNALSPNIHGDEQVVTFNLMLHHLVADDDATTRSLQMAALREWHSIGVRLFVNEYIYESYVKGAAGWLIYQITRSQALSTIGRLVAIFVPSFKANTFGVGVRFRSRGEWIRLFEEAQFRVIASRTGRAEHVAWPLRILLIREIRRDSFVLEAVHSKESAC